MLVENQTCFTFLYVVSNTLNSLINEHACLAFLIFFFLHTFNSLRDKYENFPPCSHLTKSSLRTCLFGSASLLGSSEYLSFFKNKKSSSFIITSLNWQIIIWKLHEIAWNCQYQWNYTMVQNSWKYFVIGGCCWFFFSFWVPDIAEFPNEMIDSECFFLKYKQQHLFCKIMRLPK